MQTATAAHSSKTDAPGSSRAAAENIPADNGSASQKLESPNPTKATNQITPTQSQKPNHSNNLNTGCFGKPDGWAGQFCLAQGKYHIPDTAYDCPVYLIFLFIWLGLVFAIRYMTKAILRKKGQAPLAERQLKRNSSFQSQVELKAKSGDNEGNNNNPPMIQVTSRTATKVAIWAAIFFFVLYVWVSTAINGSWPSAVFRVVLALIVVPSILIIEAVCMALIELEDKQIAKKIERLDTQKAYKIHQDYMTAGPEKYLRAREWLLALLTVVLTVVIEFESFYIPGFGTYSGKLARTAFTVVLATVAVIWIAQAPGKGVGKERPVRLLNFPIGPEKMHSVILWLVDRIENTGIDKPSDGVTYVVNGIVQGVEPKLGPGGPRLFAEVLKRYGSGHISFDVLITLNNDGSGEHVVKETVYIGKGQIPSHVRYILSDKALPEELQVIKRQAFIVPKLGASIEEDKSLWDQGESFDELLERDINYKIAWLKEDHTAAAVTFQLPDNRLEDDQAFVLKLEIRAKLGVGAFRSPANHGSDTWTHSLTKPIYESKTVISLGSDCGDGLFKSVKFRAIQKERDQVLEHFQETKHFFALQEWDPTLGSDKLQDGVSTDGRILTILLKEGLPGLVYETKWQMTSTDDHSIPD